MTREPIELVVVRPEDAHNFRIGMHVTMSVPLSLWRRIWRAATRWRAKPSRTVVTGVDVNAGIITVNTCAPEERRWRWSWRWMRWEVQTLAEDYTFRSGGPDECLWGMEPWEPLS